MIRFCGKHIYVHDIYLCLFRITPHVKDYSSGLGLLHKFKIAQLYNTNLNVLIHQIIQNKTLKKCMKDKNTIEINNKKHKIGFFFNYLRFWLEKSPSRMKKRINKKRTHSVFSKKESSSAGKNGKWKVPKRIWQRISLADWVVLLFFSFPNGFLGKQLRNALSRLLDSSNTFISLFL